jgi:hypothetical protein
MVMLNTHKKWETFQFSFFNVITKALHYSILYHNILSLFFCGRKHPKFQSEQHRITKSKQFVQLVRKADSTNPENQSVQSSGNPKTVRNLVDNQQKLSSNGTSITVSEDEGREKK